MEMKMAIEVCNGSEIFNLLSIFNSTTVERNMQKCLENY